MFLHVCNFQSSAWRVVLCMWQNLTPIWVTAGQGLLTGGQNLWKFSYFYLPLRLLLITAGGSLASIPTQRTPVSLEVAQRIKFAKKIPKPLSFSARCDQSSLWNKAVELHTVVSISQAVKESPFSTAQLITLVAVCPVTGKQVIRPPNTDLWWDQAEVCWSRHHPRSLITPHLYYSACWFTLTLKGTVKLHCLIY